MFAEGGCALMVLVAFIFLLLFILVLVASFVGWAAVLGAWPYFAAGLVGAIIGAVLKTLLDVQ
jgi:hypothetical protein